MATVEQADRHLELPTGMQNGIPSLDLAERDPNAGTDADNDDGQEGQIPPPQPPKPFVSYTRSQILYLHKSPLVKPPPNMPDLKDWFGNETDVTHKKDVEPTTPTARERRFRRDPEDGETPPRPTFRSALSQPSQMGNFKHQSVRANDRDRERERDTDKDRERDIRDKEGQERLRHLSDKYDRDRLAFPPSLVGSRTKERDIAPHLAAGPSTRLSAAQTSPVTSRRVDAREVPKKKAGETSEDWRKGSDPRSKDEGIPRKDKDDRDDRMDLDELEQDDSRRWRDDGKRPERLPARRDKNVDKERNRDRLPQESTASHEPTTDRRWTVVEERDARVKRSSGRERRIGDETKEERKEKEPAWMDTYIPSSTAGSGILGAKAEDGALDGIQTWKKGMKEREDKEREKSTLNAQKAAVPEQTEQPMDEIQLFKLMMKKEEQKKQTDVGSDSVDAPRVIESRDPVPHPPKPSAELDSLLSILSVSSGKEVTHRPTTELSNPRSTGATTSRLFPDPLPISNSYNPSERNPLEVPAQFNPPQGSRLLAFGSRTSSANKVPSVNNPTPFAQSTTAPGTNNVASAIGLRAIAPTPPSDVPRVQRGFSPFEPTRSSLNQDEYNSSDALRRGSADRSPFFSSPTGPDHSSYTDSGIGAPSSDPNGYPVKAGSRFAKFFDGKSRESAQQQIPQKPQNPSEFLPPPTTIPNQRFEQQHASFNNNPPDQRAIDDIFAMLNSSAQIPRGNPPNLGPPGGNIGFRQGQGLTPQQQQQHLHQQQLHQQRQQQHVLPNGRLDALYESRIDDRNFTPDGMVPGLRSVNAPRSRDNSAAYDMLEESMHYSGQRLPQQQRSLEQMYAAPVPGMYGQQQVPSIRNLGVAVNQQPQYRGGPSPIPSQQHAVIQSRMPAGLANLGGRPPHEPQTFGFHGAPNMGPQPQQSFNNFGGVPQQNFNQFNGIPFQQQMRHGPQVNRAQAPMRQQQITLQQAQLQQQLQLQQLQQQQQFLPPHVQQQVQQHANAELMALLMGRE